MGKREVIASRKYIDQKLKQGFNIRFIHSLMVAEGRISVGYNNFYKILRGLNLKPVFINGFSIGTKNHGKTPDAKAKKATAPGSVPASAPAPSRAQTAERRDIEPAPPLSDGQNEGGVRYGTTMYAKPVVSPERPAFQTNINSKDELVRRSVKPESQSGFTQGELAKENLV